MKTFVKIDLTQQINTLQASIKIFAAALQKTTICSPPPFQYENTGYFCHVLIILLHQQTKIHPNIPFLILTIEKFTVLNLPTDNGGERGKNKWGGGGIIHVYSKKKT